MLITVILWFYRQLGKQAQLVIDVIKVSTDKDIQVKWLEINVPTQNTPIPFFNTTFSLKGKEINFEHAAFLAYRPLPARESKAM